MSKKIKKPRKLEKKNNRKNQTMKKNWLNRLEFKKKKEPVRFGFGFISLKPKNLNRTLTEKTRKKNRAKLEKNRASRFEPVFFQNNRTEPKPVGLNRFRFFFKKTGFGNFFFIYKNGTKQKMITPRLYSQFTTCQQECVWGRSSCSYLWSYSVPIVGIRI
jgi:hypothetical protein